ncbi:hypothetical protein IJN73_00985 [Candidatus Saccharibacteria bacterium]|nr:hypothetical protein [Candidatus Saccharibacteria bacterium]
MRIGRTIGAEREKIQTESERTLYHEKIRRKKMISVAIYLAILAIIVLGIISIIVGLRDKKAALPSEQGSTEVQPTVPIVDEAGVAVSRKVREFVGYLEQDLKEYGITLARAVLPRNKTREVDVYVTDFEGYFKLSVDRGAGVSAEDMDRILRFLKGQGITGVEYVDLRVSGKGYYKGEKRAEEQPAEPKEGITEVEETGPAGEAGDDSSSVFVREGELSEGITDSEVYESPAEAGWEEEITY